jgi:hypothetical protein
MIPTPQREQRARAVREFYIEEFCLFFMESSYKVRLGALPAIRIRQSLIGRCKCIGHSPWPKSRRGSILHHPADRLRKLEAILAKCCSLQRTDPFISVL